MLLHSIRSQYASYVMEKNENDMAYQIFLLYVSNEKNTNAW